jgi:uncharacterized protein DUF1259
MLDLPLDEPISRRKALGIGGGLAAGLVAAGPLASARAARKAKPPSAQAYGSTAGKLPVTKMEAILEAEGSVSEGVLKVEVEREDIGTVQLKGVPITPAFEINGSLNFQPIGREEAFFNGDLALKPSEVDPFIDAILRNGQFFQAEHQHFYDFEPPVWFIHWRGRGEPLALAQATRDILAATSIPLPQTSPKNPKTPLDPHRLKTILHGYEASVGKEGIVTVYVARKNPIHIEDVRVQPQTNVATEVAFAPHGAGTAIVIPDFAMEGAEVNPVVSVMRAQGWDVGCLYNQETEESPQLFFSHQFRVGDPYALAGQVRRGLDRTNAQ